MSSFEPRSLRLATTMMLALALMAAGATIRAEPIVLRTRPIALDGTDSLPDRLEERQVGELFFYVGFVLESEAPAFGGFSGLELDCERGDLVAISDKGHYLAARLARAANGGLRGLADPRLEPLLDLDGAPVEGRMRQDAEEIVRLDDGVLVSFEGSHRLVLYGEPGSIEPRGMPHPVEAPMGLDETDENKGLEALARLADGRLVALTEGLLEGPETLAAWVGGPGAWQRLRFAVTEDFAPTAAATLPDGDLLLLERSYNSLLGFSRMRLSRLPASVFDTGELLVPQELGRLEPPRIVDNMEALAVCPGRGGNVWVYVMSDDNFNAEQQTLLLQFLLPDRRAADSDREAGEE